MVKEAKKIGVDTICDFVSTNSMIRAINDHGKAKIVLGNNDSGAFSTVK